MTTQDQMNYLDNLLPGMLYREVIRNILEIQNREPQFEKGPSVATNY